MSLGFAGSAIEQASGPSGSQNPAGPRRSSTPLRVVVWLQSNCASSPDNCCYEARRALLNSPIAPQGCTSLKPLYRSFHRSEIDLIAFRAFPILNMSANRKGNAVALHHPDGMMEYTPSILVNTSHDKSSCDIVIFFLRSFKILLIFGKKYL